MQNKKFLFFLIAFGLSSIVFAQEEKFKPEANTNSEQTDSQAILYPEQARNENAINNKISQPFAWDSAGDVLKYQIKIDKIDEETGKAEEVFFHETTDEEREACFIYIDPVLPPGKYRSYIYVYNILGGLEKNLTTIDTFTIRQAYKPEIKNVTYPLYMRSTIYLDDEDNNGIIEIEGNNLFEPDENKEALTFTEYYLKNDSRTIKPVSVLSHEANNKKMTFKFNMPELVVGDYNFVALDASGLHTEDNNSNKFSIKFKKLVDFDIEAGYVFPVILHDETFEKYLKSNMLPMSAQFRMTLIPFKQNWGYMGLGVRFSYSRLFQQFSTYSIDGNLGNGHLLFVYQLPMLKRHLFLELHGGVGVTYFNNILFHFEHNITSPALNTLSLSYDAGFAAQIYFNKRLYIEIAVDYSFTTNKDMILGMLMPSVGIGWQF